MYIFRAEEFCEITSGTDSCPMLDRWWKVFRVKFATDVKFATTEQVVSFCEMCKQFENFCPFCENKKPSPPSGTIKWFPLGFYLCRTKSKLHWIGAWSWDKTCKKEEKHQPLAQATKLWIYVWWNIFVCEKSWCQKECKGEQENWWRRIHERSIERVQKGTAKKLNLIHVQFMKIKAIFFNWIEFFWSFTAFVPLENFPSWRHRLTEQHLQ